MKTPPMGSGVTTDREPAGVGTRLDFPLAPPPPLPSAPEPARVSAARVQPMLCERCGTGYPADYRACPKDGQLLLDLSTVLDALIGQVLADTYTLIRAVGEGGMGRVYEARHARIGGKRFAVKVLHPEYAHIPEVLTRFQREAEAAASIENPHVGDVYDLGRASDGSPFIVAEFLDGRELAEVVRERGIFDVAEALRLVRQICDALGAAHAINIIHRDMKPENVFLIGEPERPTVKVIDFGISKVVDARGSALTKTGMIMGTPSYMTPEQARGEKVDHRVDVYATGAILYELCTGRRPFDRDEPLATVTAVLSEEPVKATLLNPELPLALEQIIERAMSKAPEDRYQSMAAFDEDLARFEAEHLSRAPAVSSPSESGERTTLQESFAPPASTDAIDARQHVRSTILGLAVLGLASAVLSLVTLSGAVLRSTRDAEEALSIAEAATIVVGSLVLVIVVASILATRKRDAHWVLDVTHVAKSRVVRGVLGGLVGYGAIALFVRFFAAAVRLDAEIITWPAWDIVGVLVGAASASYAVLRKDV